jgi:hypothetical protein
VGTERVPRLVKKSRAGVGTERVPRLVKKSRAGVGTERVPRGFFAIVVTGEETERDEMVSSGGGGIRWDWRTRREQLRLPPFVRVFGRCACAAGFVELGVGAARR